MASGVDTSTGSGTSKGDAMTTESTTAAGKPPVVDVQTWRAALDDLRRREKAATRELDAIAAERRRLPMVQMDRLHVDRSGRTHSARRYLRRPIAAHRLQPHVGRRRGMAVRWLHEPHVAVHPTRLPRQLRRPVRHRHQRSHRRGAGLPGQVGNRMEWYSSSESSFGADVDAAPNRGSPSMSSCVTAIRSTAPGTPTVAVWSSSATPSR